MRQTFAALALVTMFALCAQANAGLIARDNFAYDTGEINSQSGGTGNWVGSWSNNGNDADSEVVTPTTALTYNAGTGAETLGGGNVLQIMKQSSSDLVVNAVREFSGLAAGETFYFRYLVQEGNSNWDNNDFLVAFVAPEDGGNTSHGDDPNLGLKAGGFMARPSRTEGAETDAVPSETFGSSVYLLVGCFMDTDDDDQYDKVNLWVNPTTADDDSSYDAASSFNEAPSSEIHKFTGFRVGTNVETDDAIWIDDFAITTTLNEAIGVGATVPEPATLLSLLSGLFALCLWRKRR